MPNVITAHNRTLLFFLDSPASSTDILWELQVCLVCPRSTRSFSVPETDILDGLRACWTRVWITCGACGLFYKLIRCMRVETEAFSSFLQVGSAALPCELGPWLCLAS
ncbi:hypothetical protein PVK06_012906 [Gossypium arboreum]|uniref:Uncharacterized protein n=1 Tax=Gossypium arboreum TaxID=29729 RepID=A0ABR0QDH2_GOSAR|nr:hypothetical protein PVK06_012906 [Gossypium arboreum]